MTNTTATNTSSQPTRYAWVILVVVFLASVAAPLNQSKVPPLMPVMMESFQMTIGQAGWLMSVFALTGLLLSLPTGMLVQKLGLKPLGIVALLCLIAGSGLGALASHPVVLMISRVIEGCGMGLIAVVAPAAIAIWFPGDKQGVPMGIWAIWVPVGSVTVYNLAPSMATAFGWRSVWWLGAAFSLLVLLIFVIFLRQPPWLDKKTNTDDGNTAPSKPTDSLQALRNASIWYVGLGFGCFTLTTMALATYLPTFLVEERAYSLSQAAFVASLPTIMVLFSAPAAGWLSDRIGSRRMVRAIPFLVVGAMLFFPFQIVGWQIIAFMVFLGTVMGAVPTATFATAPEVMGKPELAGLGMAVVMFGQNLGMFIGPILFGGLVEKLGWVTAGNWLVPISLLGFILAWQVKDRPS
jgi:predicted MFS family arabinose efflux permease